MTLVTDVKLGLVALDLKSLVSAHCLTPNQSPGVPQHNKIIITKDQQKAKQRDRKNLPVKKYVQIVTVNLLII